MTSFLDGSRRVWELTIGQFIPYGASLTNLWVKDKSGKDVDVVLGYDDAAYYGMSLSPQTSTRTLPVTKRNYSKGPGPPGLQRHPRTLRQPHRKRHLQDRRQGLQHGAERRR